MCLFKSKREKELEKENVELRDKLDSLKILCEESSKNLTNYTKEIMDMFNVACGKKAVLLYDLSELPKEKEIEEVMNKFKNENIVLVETKKGESMKTHITWL